MVQYLQIGTTGVAIFSVIIAIVLVGIENKINKSNATSIGGEFDEF